MKKILFCLMLMRATVIYAQELIKPSGEQIVAKAMKAIEQGNETTVFATAQHGITTKATRNNTYDIKPLPRQAINFNALGLLQFGPVVQGEFKVGERDYFTAHVRIPYLGILYHVINYDDDSDETIVSPIALGIGAGYKSLFPVQKGAWYAGGVLEYSFGSSEGDDAGSEWRSEFSNIAVMGNGGFRWRRPDKKRTINVGAYVGLYSALRDEWWPKDDPDDVNDERSTTALFMLELSFGWER